ncbi:MAG: hypothetical protein NDI60_05135 [Elusimicrobiales bacterium]|nr:hypothetical protein [Elusimicrobiales bacterium]
MNKWLILAVVCLAGALIYFQLTQQAPVLPAEPARQALPAPLGVPLPADATNQVTLDISTPAEPAAPAKKPAEEPQAKPKNAKKVPDQAELLRQEKLLKKSEQDMKDLLKGFEVYRKSHAPRKTPQD